MVNHFQSLQCRDEAMSISVPSTISCQETEEMGRLQAKLGEMLSIVIWDNCHVVKDQKKFPGEVVHLSEQVFVLRIVRTIAECAVQ